MARIRSDRTVDEGRIGYEAVNLLLLTVGAVVGAIGFNLFLVPSSVAPGGVSGLTLIVTRLLPGELPNGVVMLAMSVPLLLLGFRALGGPSFLLRTVYAVAVMTATIDATSPFLPAEGISDDALLNALYGGATLGAANAMILRAYGNMGGTAILARVIQRRTGAPISEIYLLTDGLIVVGLGMAVGIAGAATDYGIEGPSIVRTVLIVTERPGPVIHAVQARLHTGATSWKGEGTYEGRERTVVFCTVNRAEVRELKRLLRQVDPDAFVAVGQGQTALGGTIGKSDAPG